MTRPLARCQFCRQMLRQFRREAKRKSSKGPTATRAARPCLPFDAFFGHPEIAANTGPGHGQFAQLVLTVAPRLCSAKRLPAMTSRSAVGTKHKPLGFARLLPSPRSGRRLLLREAN